MSNYKALLHGINTLIFDYDGVMTNGNVLVTEEGHPLRMANVKDGYAIQLAVKSGFNVIIISGGSAESIKKRMEMLNVKDIYMGVADKQSKLKEIMNERHLTRNQIIYVGDDIPDYPAMKLVDLPMCPADAAVEIKEISQYISHCNGGCGCVRDIIEQVLKVQNKWMVDFDAHLW